jgi:hypothetical protein
VIDGGVGLQEILKRSFVFINLFRITLLGADDARRHGLIEPEGRADGQHPIAHANLFGIAEAGGDHRGDGVDFDHRQVGLAITADHLAGRLGAVMKSDLDAIRPGDDMIVGQDVTLRIDYHARPVAAPRLFVRPEFKLLNRIARHVQFILPALRLRRLRDG